MTRGGLLALLCISLSACVHTPATIDAQDEGLEAYEKGDKGDVVVFLPGLGADVRQFKDDVDVFSKTHRALTFSMRGHGKSFRPQIAKDDDTNHHTPEAMADDVIAELDNRGIKQAHFVGNSMGGLVAFAILEKRPKLVRTLTTFGTTAELHRGGLVAFTVVAATHLIGPTGMGSLATSTASDNDDVGQLMGEMMATTSKEALTQAAQAIADYDKRELLRQSKVPYLLLKGEHDDDINSELESTLEVLQKRPHTVVRQVRGAGHLVNLDKPHGVRRELRDFYKRMKSVPHAP